MSLRGGVEPEVVEYFFCRLLPSVFEIDAAPQGAALSWTVEPDDVEAEFGKRQQERIKLFNKRIIAAVENEGASLFALRLQTKSRQMTAGIGNFDALVSGDALHRQRPVAREV